MLIILVISVEELLLDLVAKLFRKVTIFHWLILQVVIQIQLNLLENDLDVVVTC